MQQLVVGRLVQHITQDRLSGIFSTTCPEFGCVAMEPARALLVPGGSTETHKPWGKWCPTGRRCGGRRSRCRPTCAMTCCGMLSKLVGMLWINALTSKQKVRCIWCGENLGFFNRESKVQFQPPVSSPHTIVLSGCLAGVDGERNVSRES